MEELTKWERLTEVLKEITAISEQIINVAKTSRNDPKILHRELNPKRNKTYRLYIKFAAILRLFTPGEIPDPMLTDWHSSAMRLIDELKEAYPELTSLNEAETVQCDLYELLCEPYDPDMTQQEYDEEVTSLLKNLCLLYYRNSDQVERLWAEGRIEEKRRKKASVQAENPAGRKPIDDRDDIYQQCQIFYNAGYSKIEAVRKTMKHSKFMSRMKGVSTEAWYKNFRDWQKQNGIKGRTSAADF